MAKESKRKRKGEIEMKKVLLVFTMLLALVASAGWFGIITKSDVKDAFIRATWYHKVFGLFVHDCGWISAA